MAGSSAKGSSGIGVHFVRAANMPGGNLVISTSDSLLNAVPVVEDVRARERILGRNRT